MHFCPFSDFSFLSFFFFLFLFRRCTFFVCPAPIWCDFNTKKKKRCDRLKESDWTEGGIRELDTKTKHEKGEKNTQKKF